MAAPIEAQYEELVLELETATPGTYAVICGMMGLTVDRTLNIDTTESPADCTDESLPYNVRKSGRSIDIKVEGEATWAQQSHETVMDWFYGMLKNNIRIRHVAAASGDTEYEAGAALLTKLSNTRAKGKTVSATVTIEFDGTPTRTAKL